MSLKPVRSPKVRRIERWVFRRLGRIEHEQRVAILSRKLARLLAAHHDLSAAQLRLLHLGSLVHDVGRCIDEANHPKNGAKMIARSTRLPLNKREKRELAYLTRYHRGVVPPAGKDSVLRGRDDHESLRLVLAFLRAADTLDCRSLAPPRLQLSYRARVLRVICHTTAPRSKARKVYGRRKKMALLEELLDCRIAIDIRVIQSQRLAA